MKILYLKGLFFYKSALLLLKEVGNARLGESDLHYPAKTPASQCRPTEINKSENSKR